MKKKMPKKLVLSKETLKHLQPENLGYPAGGTTTTYPESLLSECLGCSEVTCIDPGCRSDTCL